jgi:hypothetical protein
VSYGYASIIATSHNACLINKRNPQLNSKKKDLKLEAILPLMPFFTFILRIWNISFSYLYFVFLSQTSSFTPPQFKTELSGFFQPGTLNIETLNLDIPLLYLRVWLNFSKMTIF